MSSTITIYHNPACSTSRNTLALIRATGIEPNIIEYLKSPPSAQTLRSLITQLGMGVRDVLRSKETIYQELDLDQPHWTDEQLIDAMVTHPVLINRPIVITPYGARLCRPVETVHEILPR